MKRNVAATALAWLWAWGAIFAAMSFAQAAPPKRWAITEISPPNVTRASANAVNNRGDVVGGAFSNDGRFLAFVWRNGAIEPLSTAAFSATAIEVNDGGTIAGIVDGIVHTWSDGVATSLGFDGAVSAINKFGVIAGGRFNGSILRGGQFRGFIFNDGVLHELPTLGGDSSRVNDLNDRGVAVGHSSISFEGDLHAFVFENGVMTDLGTLGGRESFAMGINHRGTIVGTAELADGSPAAFVREPGGPMRQLLPPFSNAQAINDRGAIVGMSPTGAVLVEDGVVRHLLDIPEVRAAGWVQLFPQDINDRGWIVGLGQKAGSSRFTGFLLTPR